MKNFKELLTELKACDEAIEWAADKTIEQVVSECHRGDWLLWLAQKIVIPLNKLTLAKSRCAKTVIHLMKDQRSIDAVLIAEKFGLDECTLEELNAASEAAWAAREAWAASAASEAAWAARAAWAASAASEAAWAARAAWEASAAAWAARAAWEASQLQTSDICREIIGVLIIDKVNKELMDISIQLTTSLQNKIKC